MKAKFLKTLCVIFILVFVPTVVLAQGGGENSRSGGEAKKTGKAEKVIEKQKKNEERVIKKQEKKAEKTLKKEQKVNEKTAKKGLKKKEKELRKANKLTGRENALTRGKGNKYGLKRVVSEDATGKYEKGRKNAISKISELIKRLPSNAYDGLKNAIISIGKFLRIVPEEPVKTDYQA